MSLGLGWDDLSVDVVLSVTSLVLLSFFFLLFFSTFLFLIFFFFSSHLLVSPLFIYLFFSIFF